MKNIKLIGLIMLIMTVIFAGCNNNVSNTNVEDDIVINDNVNNNQQNVESSDNKEEDNGDDVKITEKNIEFITENSKDLLPTLDDLDIGWEMSLDKAKDKNEWSLEDVQRLESRGFVEGYNREFKKGSANFDDLKNNVDLSFSISLYDNENIDIIIKETNDKVNLGEKKYNETITDEEYNEESGEWEEVTYDEEKVVKFSKLKTIQRGDNNIFYSITQDTFVGEIKAYVLEFTHENVYVQVYCGSFDTQYCIDLVTNTSKLIENNINNRLVEE